jgi:hypothetical protein
MRWVEKVGYLVQPHQCGGEEQMVRLENIYLELEGVCVKKCIGRVVFRMEKDCG